jgi:hypothetical protein
LVVRRLWQQLRWLWQQLRWLWQQLRRLRQRLWELDRDDLRTALSAGVVGGAVRQPGGNAVLCRLCGAQLLCGAELLCLRADDLLPQCDRADAGHQLYAGHQLRSVQRLHDLLPADDDVRRSHGDGSLHLVSLGGGQRLRFVRQLWIVQQLRRPMR